MNADQRTTANEPERPATVWFRAINRTQGMVLGFFTVAWVTLAVILAWSQSVREMTLPGTGTPVVLAFLAGLLTFLTVLGIGVIRRWRWLFWLLLLAFAVGLARVPVAVLQLSGRMPPHGPDWYVVLQGVSGVAQAGLAFAMLAGYRRAGPWAAY